MYNNDDIISDVREIQEQNYALVEKVDKLTKLVEGMQAQLGIEVDALAKLIKLGLLGPTNTEVK
jgi:hypothetical protein